MCKTLVTFLFLLLTFTAFSQSTLQVKTDTVIVKKAEFAIENKTRDTLGFLYNTGNGRTQFKRLDLVNLGDTALAIVGQDTITYKSASIGKSIQFKVGAAGAPNTGDTIYTNVGLRYANIKVWRNGLFQYRDTTDGVMVDSVNGRIRFYPALAQADRIYIESLFGVSLNFQLSAGIPTVVVRDTSITLPSSGLQLTCSVTPNGNTISGYQWSQLTGPNTSTITNAGTQTCTITGLISGTYTFRLTVTTVGGQQGPEEAFFEYFKLRKSTVPDHISSFLPIALQKCKWQCISVVEGLDEFNNRILDVNSNTAIDIALLSDLLNALIGHEDKWVVVFEPDCDRVDEVSKGSIADVLEQILQSLQVGKKGFIIWYNYGF